MKLEVRFKQLSTTGIPEEAQIQDIFRLLVQDDNRNQQIAADIMAAYGEGRKILVLTERTEHLQLLLEKFDSSLENLLVLHGRVPKKQRMEIYTKLNSIDATAPRIIFATGRLIGEGFDHPPLDTLVLAMPISWKGTLQQYAGRLHREHADKHDIRIYDYVEQNQPKLARMWEKRKRGYQIMGYTILN
jgi:superfamily II DNA or RNA helicase